MANDLTPVTRLEKILANLTGEAYDITPVTRIEKLFDNLLDGSYAVIPATRIEKFISDLKEAGYDLTAVTRIEKFLNKTAAEAGLVPVTRLEKFLDAIELERELVWTPDKGDMKADPRFTTTVNNNATFELTENGMLFTGTQSSDSVHIRPMEYLYINNGYIEIEFNILSRVSGVETIEIQSKEAADISYGFYNYIYFWYGDIYNLRTWSPDTWVNYRASNALMYIGSDYKFKVEYKGRNQINYYINDVLIAENTQSARNHSTSTNIRIGGYVTVLLKSLKIYNGG